MTLAKEDPSGTVNDVIKKIVGSKLGDTEKLLLAIEWILREYTVYDLFEMSPAEMKRVVKLRLENFFADDYINSTLTLAKKTVNLSKDKNALIFLIALAYFLYIDDEFVYDVVTREQLFSKEKSLGFSIQEIKTLIKTWTERLGDPATLFMRFLK